MSGGKLTKWQNVQLPADSVWSFYPDNATDVICQVDPELTVYQQ